MTVVSHSRRAFLAGIAALATGGTAATAYALSGQDVPPLGRRFGRTISPRLSVAFPESWFMVERATDVLDPVQLFTVANHAILAPHRNIHGTINPSVLDTGIALVTASAFEITDEMAIAHGERLGSPPTDLALDSFTSPHPFGDMGLATQTWSAAGQRYGIALFTWIGDNAPAGDVATLDAVLRNLTFDEAF